MKCRVCGREIGDEEQFCKYCGSEQKRKRKRLTWGERKRKNEAETKEFIAKASLQAEEVKEAAEESSASVRAVFVESAEKYYRKSVALTALFALLTVAAFAALVLIRFAEMNDTLTVVIAFALLIVAAYCAASFAERLYAARSLSAMRKSGRGIKKLRYAHPPVMLCDGKIYRLEPTEKCPVCGAERHLEEFEGRQVLVCNADRGHIAVLSSEGLFALVTGGIAEGNDETVPGIAAEAVANSDGSGASVAEEAATACGESGTAEPQTASAESAEPGEAESAEEDGEVRKNDDRAKDVDRKE